MKRTPTTLTPTEPEIIYQNTYCPHLLSHFHNSFLISHPETLSLSTTSSSAKQPKSISTCSPFLLSNPLHTYKYFSFQNIQNTCTNNFINNLNISWIALNNRNNLSFSSMNREGCIFAMSFDVDGSTMMSSNQKMDYSIEIWDIENRKLKKVLSKHKEIVTGLEFFHGSNNMFLSCYLDKTIKLWKNYNYAHTFIEHSDWIKCIAINQTNRNFISGCVSSIVKLWDLEKHKVISTINNPKPDPDALSTVNSLGFIKSNDSVFYAAYRTGEIKFYDTRMPKQNGVHSVGMSHGFKCHSAKLNSVKINNTENYILSSGKESQLKLWDMRKLPSSLTDPYVNDKMCLMQYKGHKCFGFNIEANFFCEDNYVITGSEDSNIYIYDRLTGKIAKKIQTHQKCINLLKPVPKTIASFACTGLEDTAIFIWDAQKNISQFIDNKHSQHVIKENKQPIDEDINDSLNNNKDYSGFNYSEEDELKKYDERNRSQEIYSKMLEDIMSECGDAILKIFHSHNLTYSTGISLMDLMDTIRQTKDESSMRTLKEVNDKFMKKMMENLVNEARSKLNKTKVTKKETVVKERKVSCVNCSSQCNSVNDITNVNRMNDFHDIMKLPNRNNSFSEIKKDETNDYKEHNEEYNDAIIKKITNEGDIAFNEKAYLLNKFL